MATRSKNWRKKKGHTNRATEEARVAAAARGTLPIDYMLSVMNDRGADLKRRDAMATAVAPYLHPKPATSDAIGIDSLQPSNKPSIEITFVRPTSGPDDEDPRLRELILAAASIARDHRLMLLRCSVKSNDFRKQTCT
jgi:hypothetical protein